MTQADEKRPPVDGAPPLEPAGFFVLRTPLLPARELHEWGAGVDGLAIASLAQLRARLLEITRRPEIRDALWLSSPSLAESLGHWEQQPESERGQRVEKSLVRYFSRMCRRPTPFGLMAGISLGQIGEGTKLALVERAQYRRHTIFSLNVLDQIANERGRAPHVPKTLRFTLNTSLAEVHGTYSYQRPVPLPEGGFSYERLQIEPSPVLTAILQVADGAGATREALRKALRKLAVGSEASELDALIDQVIDAGLIESELGPRLTGPDAARDLAAQLARHPSTAAAGSTLEGCAAELQALDRAGLGASEQRYQAIAAKVGELTKVDPAHLFHAELVKPGAELRLSRGHAAELLKGVELLAQLVAPKRDLQREELAALFERRFGDREVPLAEALNTEFGIGEVYGSDAVLSPASEPLELPLKPEPGPALDARARHLIGRVDAALRSKTGALALAAADVAKLGSGAADLPAALAVMAVYDAPSPEALAHGDYQVLISFAGGPSGAEWLGRFCNGDAHLHAAVKDLLRREEALTPEVRFAELVHLQPGLKEGAILARPVLRAYEIPYLGRSGIARKQQIPVADLLVSLRSGRFRLRSKRLDVEIVPRMSNAHAIGTSQTMLYQFLNLIIRQDDRPVAWSWGAAGALPRLPRVTFGRFIFALAKWRFDQAATEELATARGPALLRIVERWRSELAMPRHVALVQFDNKLAIDLENPLSIAAFPSVVTHASEMELEELFPAPDRLCVTGPEGHFTHELLVPFVRGPAPVRAKTRSRPARKDSTHEVARRLLPGSSCLYLKLYGGVAGADRILSHALPSLLAGARTKREVDHWFFIRYADPDHHLRLRFFGPRKQLWSGLARRIDRWVLQLERQGLVSRVQIDSYDREIVRYGGEQGIELAERLFHFDSEAVVGLLCLPDLEAAPLTRWSFALSSADGWLTDLGFDQSRRQAIVERAAKPWSEQLGADAGFRHRLGARYRELRKDVESVLNRRDLDPQTTAALAPLDQRSRRTRPYLRKLLALAASGRLTVTVDELAISLLHMAMNRAFRSNANLEELVVYDFLGRCYQSQLARSTAHHK